MRAPARGANLSHSIERRLLLLLSPRDSAESYGTGDPGGEVWDTRPAGASTGAEVGVGTASGKGNCCQRETGRGAGRFQAGRHAYGRHWRDRGIHWCRPRVRMWKMRRTC